MENKKIVVALGRNAFGETFPEQQANVKKAAVAIADLVEAKYQIVITHSNGPQVGMIQTASWHPSRLCFIQRPYCSTNVCMWCNERRLYRLRPSECNQGRTY